MKNTINLSIILFAFLTGTSFSFAQDISETEKIIKYLESTIEYSDKIIVSNTAQEVAALDIIKNRLVFETGENYGSVLREQYFINSDNKLTPFKTATDILSSNEFIESIKAKKFKLSTEEDGVAFQTMLKLIDTEPGFGFFKENLSWYFIRSKFFDDIRAYVVVTDTEGQISSIVYKKKLMKEVPKILQKIGAYIPQNKDSEKSIISKKDSTYMHNYLLDKVNCVFEISPRKFYSVNKKSAPSIFECAFTISTDDDATSKHRFMLVSNSKEYLKPSRDEILKMPFFLEYLQEQHKIKTEEDARLFQDLLDNLTLFSSSNNDVKTFYNKENIWVFVREKSFGDLKGYILKIDVEYRISYIEYTTISDENIARIKKKNSNLKVD